MPETPCDLVVAGRVDDAAFQKARAIAEELEQQHSNVRVEQHVLFDSEWRDFVASRANQLGLSKEDVASQASPLVYYNRKHLVGSLQEFVLWAGNTFDVKRPESTSEYESRAAAELKSLIESKRRQFAYLDVAIRPRESEEGAVHRVVVELYDDVCAKTTKNFLRLCTGAGDASYAGTPFHRVVPGGWVQGGDITDGSGAHSESAAGNNAIFPDENFAVKHDRAGIISMANTGKSHSNGSQFFVTLQALPWLDRKRVAFGRVVYGLQAFYSIEAMSRKNERPQGLCEVYACGSFDGSMGLEASPNKIVMSASAEEKGEGKSSSEEKL